MSQMDSDQRIDTETYGVSELREGFFDAVFLKPPPLSTDDLLEQFRDTLPADFDKASPLAPRYFFPRQWHELQSLFRRVTTTRAGIRLLKSFTAFFVAYVLCLIPDVRAWLGQYHYFAVVSVLINHPARSFGAQVDGTIFTIAGTAAGLGWGAVGLLLSTSTGPAQAGYGGILALFLALLMTSVAWVRSFFIRFYQAVLCAGIAIIFTALAETSSRGIQWEKLLNYGVPWLCGQAIALVVNCLVFPDAGARAVATTLHNAFTVMQESLDIPRPRDKKLRRRLVQTFVNLSQGLREMRMDITITRFRPDDIQELRNLLQAVIRAILSLDTETCLFKDSGAGSDAASPAEGPASRSSDTATNGTDSTSGDAYISRRVKRELSGPTKDVISCMSEGLLRCHAALMDLSGYRRYLGPSATVSSDLEPIRTLMVQVKSAFDTVESNLLDSDNSPASSIQDPDVVKLFVFSRHARETASTIENLMTKVHAMQHASDWPRIYLPSYPFWKAVHRTNAVVWHDRGGVAAGSYQITFAEIAHLLDNITSTEYKPTPREGTEIEKLDSSARDSATAVDAKADANATPKGKRLRYKTWRIFYHLQGFDSKYAFKVCIVTGLLSIPGYLNLGWWNEYEAWWAVIMSWIAIHPRVGGNPHDLVIRGLLAILGAAWGGAGYAAGNGNPYVMAAFATVYMLPMLYRYTQSSHPRSGLVGCLSFSVISLGLQARSGGPSPASLATFKGIAFLVGTTVPIVVNWVLWPFVARHELRSALSSMMFFMSVIYRSVVARYVYFQEGKEPTPEDVERSEMLEGRMREGFVRIRQLLVLTQKEMRLRAPFEPAPYSALADSCERFFEHLIAVRQSALFYNPGYIRDNPLAAEQLLTYRRDAVASILGNLYILAGALRSQRKVPRYMPSAAASRRRLLDKTAEVEEDMSKHARDSDVRWHKKWSNIYSFSFNQSLTGCVLQLEELEKYTKLIVGEQGFDDEFQYDGSDAEGNTGHGDDR